MRLTAQLEDINQVIYKEPEEGAQDPEWLWSWLPKKRDDLQSSGRGLTNSEIYDYFAKCKIVLEYQLPEMVIPLPDGGFRQRSRGFTAGIVSKEICRPIKYLWEYGEFGFEEKEIWICRNLRWGDNSY